MKKRVLTIILSLLLILSVFTGCGKKKTADDFAKAADYYKSDLVMVMTDDGDITWEEYINWLRLSVASFEASLGSEVKDWNEKITEDGDTFSDYVNDYAVYMIKLYKSIERSANELGVELTEEQKTQISGLWDTIIQQDGEESVIKTYGSRDFYEYLMGISFLYDNCYANQYGENGDLISDEEALKKAEDMGFMHAKHILLLTIDENNESFDDAKKAELYAQMEGFLKQLREYKGNDIEAEFDKIMFEYSEDTGLEGSPDGYLFASGEMVEEFENAARALDDYEISDIVETTYGYHILLKLPIDLDQVPTQYQSTGYDYSMKKVVTQELFSIAVDGLCENYYAEPTDAQMTLNLAEILK